MLRKRVGSAVYESLCEKMAVEQCSDTGVRTKQVSYEFLVRCCSAVVPLSVMSV